MLHMFVFESLSESQLSLEIRQHRCMTVRTEGGTILKMCHSRRWSWKWNVWNAERMNGGCQSPVLGSRKQTRPVSQLKKRTRFSEVTCHFWFLVMLRGHTPGGFTVWLRITRGEPERWLDISNLIFTKTFPVWVTPDRVRFTTWNKIITLARLKQRQTIKKSWSPPTSFQTILHISQRYFYPVDVLENICAIKGSWV